MPLNEKAINEILPFAAEGLEEAGDLLPLEEYKAHTMRLRGHMAGLALRELQNRANRQSAHMAAGLAQFIANRYAPGVVDDADLDKVEAGLALVIQAMIDAGAFDPATCRINTTAPLTGGGNLSTSLTLTIDDASASAKGAVQLATGAETSTGTLTTKAVTPAGLSALFPIPITKGGTGATTAAQAKINLGIADWAKPQTEAGVGQWINLDSSNVTVVLLPSGGTWAYQFSVFQQTAGTFFISMAGVAAGGTSISTLITGKVAGLAWRVA